MSMTPADILDAVAEAAELSVSAIRGPSRAPDLVRARQAAILIMREQSGATFYEIADCLHRDHSTVCSSYYKVARILGLQAKAELVLALSSKGTGIARGSISPAT